MLKAFVPRRFFEDRDAARHGEAVTYVRDRMVRRFVVIDREDSALKGSWRGLNTRLFCGVATVPCNARDSNAD